MYSKLLRYREEQLEHYEGPPLGASMSDHHHVTTMNKMGRRSSTRASLRFLQAQRPQSQYSLADHHLQSLAWREDTAPQRHVSVAETEKTAESYDPYRPSRDQVAKSQAGPARVTVLREESQTSRRRQSSTSVEGSSLKSTTPRFKSEATDVYSIPSSPPTKHSSGAFHVQRKLTSHHHMSRGNSRVTIGSVRTGMSGSSPFVARKRASYKRTVSFQHDQRRSVSSGQPQLRSRERQPVSKTLQERYVRDQAKRQPHASSSPSSLLSRDTPMPDAQPFIRSRKEGTKTTPGSSIPRLRGETNWNDDVRKISTELDKLCDTAFNRVSISSSAPTAITPGSGNRGSQGRNYSSATSFSIFEDQVSEIDERHAKIGMKDVSTQADDQRPLPPPPTMDPLAQDRLGSYTQRELAKTRDLLKKRNRASYMEPGYLDDVIAHLDRLMQPSNIRLVDEERRAVTDPSSSGLPRKDTFEQIMENGDIGFRSASEPTDAASKRRNQRLRDQRIRVVEDTSDGYKPLSPIKPLTIRKRSGASSNTASSTTPTKRSNLLIGSQAPPSNRSNSHSAGPTPLDRTLDPIKEFDNFDPEERNRKKDSFIEYKKRSWFRSQPQSKPPRHIESGPPPPVTDYHQVYDCEHKQEVKRASATSDESQTSETKTRSKGGGFFRKIFTGKRDPKSLSGNGDYHLNDGASFDTEVSSINHHSRGRQVGQSTVGMSPYYAGSLNAPKRKRDRSDQNDHRSIDTQGTTGRENNNNNDTAEESSPISPEFNSSTPFHHHHHHHSAATATTATTTTTVTNNHARPIRQRASNWLARFLGIKPATHVLCFQVNKLRARREIASVFREWRRFGMRDVVVDKTACRVSARVGGKNCSC